MELRHLRYFVAVAETGSFTRAGETQHVAQPALSRQMSQLEREVGVTLFERHPRGVRLTPAGDAFLVEARRALEHAGLAAEAARGSANKGGQRPLRLAHGQLFVYGGIVEELLAEFRKAHPGVRVLITSQDDRPTHDALIAGTVDIGCVFSSAWPLEGFQGCRLVEILLTGVLLPGSHPLAAARAVRLADLRDLPWLTLGPRRWPGDHAILDDALRSRGLVARASTEGPGLSLSFHVAAGEGWALASEAAGAPYVGQPGAIVYRPFEEPPIPTWLALVWPSGSSLAEPLVAGAQRLGLVVLDDMSRASTSRMA